MRNSGAAGLAVLVVLTVTPAPFNYCQTPAQAAAIRVGVTPLQPAPGVGAAPIDPQSATGKLIDSLNRYKPNKAESNAARLEAVALAGTSSDKRIAEGRDQNCEVVAHAFLQELKPGMDNNAAKPGYGRAATGGADDWRSRNLYTGKLEVQIFRGDKLVKRDTVRISDADTPERAMDMLIDRAVRLIGDEALRAHK
jgi:hypothetical protein